MRRLAITALLVAGCGSTTEGPVTPPVIERDLWTIPLVSPLEASVPLLVPVEVNGRGPYLFAIDPDAPMSRLDEAVATELGLVIEPGADYIDELEAGHQTRIARAATLELGELVLPGRDLWVAAPGAFKVAGHAVKGLIGADLLGRWRAFGFDRARGIAWLATPAGFTPPPGAAVIATEPLAAVVPGPMPAVPRRQARATIDGVAVTVHVDLGDPHSQLREPRAAELGLAPFEREITLVDDAGGRRTVERGVTGAVTLDGAHPVAALELVPYVEARWGADLLDGALGLDYFFDHAVAVDLERGAIHVAPAAPVETAARVARWGSVAVNGCAATACASASLITPTASTPDRPVLPVATVTRTDEVRRYAYEVLLEARGPDGAALDLPKLIAVLPVDVTKVTQLIDERFAGASLAIIDVSPLPRTCTKGSGCLYVTTE